MSTNITEPTYSDVGELVRRTETNFLFSNLHPSQYVNYSPYEDISKIEAYLMSVHTTGDKDSLGRDKPFFNIVLAARNIWFRATDLDRKNIRIQATKSGQTIAAFMATQLLQNWMRKTNFGQFLNNWGLDLAGYNASVTKFVEQDGELFPMVIPWNRLIVDFINFDQNPVIEMLELTPAQLKQRVTDNGYDAQAVSDLISSVSARQNMDKSTKDVNNNYIKIYEVHGNLPKSYLTGKDDDSDIFVQQMHVISFLATNTGKGKGDDYDDFTLYAGKEDKSPYMLTQLIPATDGSISLIGAVKSLFDAQWMQNHSAKLIKDQLDLASKLIFQTSDGNYVNQNALFAIETGDILVHALNQPLTQLQNNSHDIASLQSYQQQWKSLAQEITSTPDILQGANMPSGTAFRQAAIIQQEAHDNFEIMTENKGLAVEKMLREFIIPFLKKKLNNSDEIVAQLEAQDITKIDGIYVKNEAIKKTNNAAVEAVIAGKGMTPEEQATLTAENSQNIQNELNQDGNKRFFKPSEVSDKTWKDMMEDLEWEVEIDITGENKDKQSILATLTTVFQTVAGLKGQPMSPEMKFVFNKIISETDAVSPLELSSIQSPPPQVPQQQPAVGGGIAVGGGNLTANQ